MVVATTRPETLLGDTALAVNPNDERYAHLVGKNVLLPLTSRRIPVVADDYVAKEFGSGVVKITPAHDFNDYEVAKRHKLPLLNIITTNGLLNENAGAYRGLKLQEARKRVLADLQAKELLESEEPYTQTVPISQRTGAVIEPYLSQQWFMAVKNPSGPSRSVVETGTTRFIPEQWTKTYLHWMSNIEDWCISRQLWWGHRIPAWYCQDCKHITVSMHDATKCEKCNSVNLKQDEDVLDTWFSSALWPFSTLGWPAKTEALKTFYPTDVLVTGHDIIFFWVARMIMQGIHFMGDVPFRTVFIHGIVRDAEGKKMSKSVGNVMDPLEIIDDYGADALRFTLLAMISGGRDLKLSDQRLDGYRNFMNKIWNATRFSLQYLDGVQGDQMPNKSDLSSYDKWITFRLKEVEEKVQESLEEFRFSDAANALYAFVWNDFCDWYLEFTKPILNGDNEKEKQATRIVLAQTLNRIVRLLHPFVPFITEEIYHRLPIKNEACIIDQYPTPQTDREWLNIGNKEAAHEVELIKEVIVAIRNVRGENRIKPGVKIKVTLVPFEAHVQKILGINKPAIMKMGGIDICEVDTVKSYSKCAVAPVQVGADKVDVVIPLEGLVDFDEEIQRIEKSIEKNSKELHGIRGRLQNENFVKNAPEDVVIADKERMQALDGQISSLKKSLERLRT
jgi:valyl-tRNA synthetase